MELAALVALAAADAASALARLAQEPAARASRWVIRTVGVPPVSTIPGRERAPLHAPFPRELAKRLTEYTAANCVASSKVVQAAFRQCPDRTRDTALILRRLARLARTDAGTHKLLSEADR
jgi:hypothetical protein